MSLEALAAQVRADLDRIAHPRASWLTPYRALDGTEALDVLIAGAGQGGLATAHGLHRAKVTNILLVDRAERGREGPWLTYARMPTLRSPKDYTGPDLGIPSLTYQSWHEAKYGPAHWASLDLIPREDWAAYLLWFRDTLNLPVQNETTVTGIAPANGNLLAVTLRAADGTETIRHTRKLVLATGQESTGEWWMPDFLKALPQHLRAHSADPIDFAALQGKVVAVIGAGASALDNAAMALEVGAREVRLLCRRAEPQVVQPYRWLTFTGFLRHLADLPDEWRWRFMSRILGLREGFPQHTWDRCARHPNFILMAGAPVTGASAEGETAILETPRGSVRADFAIAGTGIEMNPALRPELSTFATNIATWADHYTPPASERDDRLARFPYLAPDFAFTERRPGETPWIRDVHLFSIASTMSFGPSGSSINAMTTAVPKLVNGLTRALFAGDVERHWAELQAYDVPQTIIAPKIPA
ncbi:NAD(P)-binding domain-containing protein [Pararoseomonas indoligenes]|uniref:NAD(P)/FAD-dependent oxidoreductase n=1 Tax=Roseomonas indoligenes TaxID=2820811 RepID=A0A940MUH9_9PROT|nr:NAD(P)/FAD-dependent oxidoreductase [Pararoseomonas indoligenes]MBP0493669.1 NAD(P)/FAD-dependent oxidoreductase [Pararoseomonas indoligenes]